LLGVEDITVQRDLERDKDELLRQKSGRHRRHQGHRKNWQPASPSALLRVLSASAMQGYEGEFEKAIVLTLFIPLIMSSGGNSGSQATSLLIRALALRQLEIKDWWRVALREIPSGLALGRCWALSASSALRFGSISASTITATGTRRAC
jgi:Divalent cation transporter